VKVVVADAGPLIALAVAQLLPFALKQFQLYVPQVVVDECLADMYAPGAQSVFEAFGQAAFTLIPQSAIEPLDSAYAMGLGSGEVAVLSYARKHNQVALIDERRARSVAKRLGVAVVGSGAVLIALKHSGVIASIQPALKSWHAHGYFLAPAQRNQLLSAAGELADANPVS
jgi:uncharacterized protein